ncbi:RNA-binding protein lark-like isoform X1 [Panulirus ornatus]|uniref:RNA-binding protein lark-like isoform X1 n=1 Tax=Panulirus ornatus TaxID=150431 RepID=UPI003A896DA5
MESINTLMQRLERVDLEPDRTCCEKTQSDQNHMEDKESLQTRLEELQTQYEKTRLELEATREALAKFQSKHRLITTTKEEASLHSESAALETSLNSQVIKLELELKQIATKKPIQGKTYKIFVGNLSHRATTSEIRHLFESHGTVVEADVLKSYGFVHMEKKEEGLAAIEGLNGHILDGRPMVVKASTGAKKGVSQTTKIFVGNVPRDSKREELKSLFEVYGIVVEADILTNYAFIHMDDEAQAQRAIRELDGYEFNGMQLRVRKSTSHGRQQTGIGNPDMCLHCGSSSLWSKQCYSDELFEGSRYSDRERGGRSYVPQPQASYAREHFMHYRGDFDHYDRFDCYFGEGLYEHPYVDHPPPPTLPMLNDIYKRRLPHVPPHTDELQYGRCFPGLRYGPPDRRLY